MWMIAAVEALLSLEFPLQFDIASVGEEPKEIHLGFAAQSFHICLDMTTWVQL